jgi:outer membrane lipoprotein SlyB
METNKTSNRLHPLMAAAAIAVLLVSLTGIAAMTGLLPSSFGTPKTSTSLSESSANQESKTAAADNDVANTASIPDSKNNVPARTHVTTHATTAPQSRQAADVCHSCGRVESIQTVQQTAKPSGVGVVAGAVIGGVLGNQVGAGNGRALSTAAGAVGGGFAGNEIEKRTHTTTAYQIHVRMEDGHMRTFTQHKENVRVGDRVKIVNGVLTAEG